MIEYTNILETIGNIINQQMLKHEFTQKKENK